MIAELRNCFVAVLTAMLTVACSSCTGQPPPNGQEKSAMSPPAGCPQQQLTAEDIAAIKAAINDGAAHYKNGHFSNFKNKFSSDGEVAPPNGPPKVGQDAIESFAKDSPKIDMFAVHDIGEPCGSGNQAKVTAKLTMTGMTTNAAGDKIDDPVSSAGSLAIVMKKKDGAWLATKVTYAPN